MRQWSDDADDDDDEDEVVLVKVSCALHSAVTIIIGAPTEPCLTAATSLLLPLVPREVMPENNMPTVCLIFTGQQAFI